MIVIPKFRLESKCRLNRVVCKCCGSVFSKGETRHSVMIEFCGSEDSGGSVAFGGESL